MQSDPLAQIKKLVNRGLTIKAIAEQIGVSKFKVAYWLKVGHLTGFGETHEKKLQRLMSAPEAYLPARFDKGKAIADDPVLSDFIGRLRELERANVPIKTLAEQIGVKPLAMSFWLRKRSIPRFRPEYVERLNYVYNNRERFVRGANRPPTAMEKSELEERTAGVTVRQLAAELGVSMPLVLKWRQIKRPLRMKQCYADEIRRRYPLPTDTPPELIQEELPFDLEN